MEPRNRCQGINSASLCSLAGRYDNPIPTRCLAPIDFLKIPALAMLTEREGLKFKGRDLAYALFVHTVQYVHSYVFPMSPKARGLVQNGGSPGWLDESNPAGCDFVSYGRSIGPCHPCHLPWWTTPLAWSEAALLLNVHKTQTWWKSHIACRLTVTYSIVKKPNSWMYNFLEISGHNLESSQTWGFCMDFLNHREGSMVFYHVFFLSTLQCTVETVRGCVSSTAKL